MEYKGIEQDKTIMLALNIIRSPFVYPGQYSRIGITDDGEVVCRKCVKDNLHKIAKSSKGDCWHIVTSEDIENYNNEALWCANCGKVVNRED